MMKEVYEYAMNPLPRWKSTINKKNKHQLNGGETLLEFNMDVDIIGQVILEVSKVTFQPL
jgi:hypothetical protein